AKPEDDPRNWRMTITNGLYYGDGWSFSFTPGNGGSAATSLDEAANVSQYWIAVNEARLAANLAKAEADAYADGYMLKGRDAQRLIGTLQMGGSVSFNMDGTVDYKLGNFNLSSLENGNMSTMVASINEEDYLTQSENPVEEFVKNNFGSKYQQFLGKVTYIYDDTGNRTGPSAPGDTRGFYSSKGRIQLSINSSAFSNGDPDFLWLVIGHEIVHATDRLGDYQNWLRTYGYYTNESSQQVSYASAISEYNAYSWQLNMIINYGFSPDQLQMTQQQLNYYSNHLPAGYPK
ncbi:MAG: hypothetical protein JST69_14575, partial [Bacteroidetes bacterium]|nr:hypothetical protein [Bacteroidota bacterium]